MIKEVILLNERTVKIVKGGKRFEKPDELINFVKKYPKQAEAMEEKGIIKIVKQNKVANGK